MIARQFDAHHHHRILNDMQSSSCKYLVPILDFILIFDTQCSFLFTKEQLNFYEDSSSMKKLDQIHLLTPMGANDDPGDSSSGKKKSKNRNKEGRGNSPVRRDTMEGGSAAALGLNETKTCYLAITWDYENAQRSTPTEKVRENCFCRSQRSPFVNILASQVLSLSIYVISFCFSFRHFFCWEFPRDNNNAKTNAYH